MDDGSALHTQLASVLFLPLPIHLNYLSLFDTGSASPGHCGVSGSKEYGPTFVLWGQASGGSNWNEMKWSHGALDPFSAAQLVAG